MVKNIKSMLKNEDGASILGLVGGSLLGVLTEVGLCLFDVSGIGVGNLPGIYPCTSLHIFPLAGLTASCGTLGWIAGTVVDRTTAAITSAISTLGCVGSSIIGMVSSK